MLVSLGQKRARDRSPSPPRCSAWSKEADILAGFAGAAEAIAIDTAVAEELLEILNRSHLEARVQRRHDAERLRRELAAREPQEDQLRLTHRRVGRRRRLQAVAPAHPRATQ